MKNLLIKAISLLCCVALLFALPAGSMADENEEVAENNEVQSPEVQPAEQQSVGQEPEEERPATPTDLSPIDAEEIKNDTPSENDEISIESEEPESKGSVEDDEISIEPEAQENKGPAEVVEITITRALSIGESWSGVMRKTQPAVLKLDLDRAQHVNLIVEGKNVWFTTEKSDRLTENPSRTRTEPETNRAILSWNAETGSYLITIGPVEPNLMGKATVTILNDQDYDTWLRNQEVLTQQDEGFDNETGHHEEILLPASSESATEDENTEQPAPDVYNDEEEPEPEFLPERHIDVELTWDRDVPVIGDTAHLKATLSGYENLTYTLQWQGSPDDQNWTDVPGARSETFDVVITKELNHYYWRIVVYMEDPGQE